MGSDLSGAQLLDHAKLVCFCAVGGPLPLPTKPLSDCQAVKRPPITGGNSGFKVPVYSAHAATLQRLVITICSGFFTFFPTWLPFFSLVNFRFSVLPFPVYWIYFPSAQFRHPLAVPPLSSKLSIFELLFALGVLRRPWM